jgi:hypothetical protein
MKAERAGLTKRKCFLQPGFRSAARAEAQRRRPSLSFGRFERSRRCAVRLDVTSDGEASAKDPWEVDGGLHWLAEKRAALWIAARSRAAVCCITFELTPTAEAGTVSLDCENAQGPQARLTVPAVAGRGVERGVRPHCRHRPCRDLDGVSNALGLRPSASPRQGHPGLPGTTIDSRRHTSRRSRRRTPEPGR